MITELFLECRRIGIDIEPPVLLAEFPTNMQFVTFTRVECVEFVKRITIAPPWPNGVYPCGRGSSEFSSFTPAVFSVKLQLTTVTVAYAVSVKKMNRPPNP